MKEYEGLTICALRHTIAVGGCMTTIGQADFDILTGIVPVMDALDRIGARAAVTGGLAAVAHGVGRTVSDVDIVADLTPAQLRDLVARLQSCYAVDQRMA